MLIRSHNLDVIASVLRSQINKLEEILRDIEYGHTFNSLANEYLKDVEKSLRLLRQQYFNHKQKKRERKDDEKTTYCFMDGFIFTTQCAS